MIYSKQGNVDLRKFERIISSAIQGDFVDRQRERIIIKCGILGRCFLDLDIHFGPGSKGDVLAFNRFRIGTLGSGCSKIGGQSVYAYYFFRPIWVEENILNRKKEPESLMAILKTGISKREFEKEPGFQDKINAAIKASDLAEQKVKAAPSPKVEMKSVLTKAGVEGVPCEEQLKGVSERELWNEIDEMFLRRKASSPKTAKKLNLKLAKRSDTKRLGNIDASMCVYIKPTPDVTDTQGNAVSTRIKFNKQADTFISQCDPGADAAEKSGAIDTFKLVSALDRITYRHVPTEAPGKRKQKPNDNGSFLGDAVFLMSGDDVGLLVDLDEGVPYAVNVFRLKK